MKVEFPKRTAIFQNEGGAKCIVQRRNSFLFLGRILGMLVWLSFAVFWVVQLSGVLEMSYTMPTYFRVMVCIWLVGWCVIGWFRFRHLIKLLFERTELEFIGSDLVVKKSRFNRVVQKGFPKEDIDEFFIVDLGLKMRF